MSTPNQAEPPLPRVNSPVYDEAFIGGLLITHGADPAGFLFIHLQVQGSIKTLQVRAGHCPARHRQPHLPQLEETTQPHHEDAMFTHDPVTFARSGSGSAPALPGAASNKNNPKHKLPLPGK